MFLILNHNLFCIGWATSRLSEFELERGQTCAEYAREINNYDDLVGCKVVVSRDGLTVTDINFKSGRENQMLDHAETTQNVIVEYIRRLVVQGCLCDETTISKSKKWIKHIFAGFYSDIIDKNKTILYKQNVAIALHEFIDKQPCNELCVALAALPSPDHKNPKTIINNKAVVDMLRLTTLPPGALDSVNAANIMDLKWIDNLRARVGA